MKNTVIMAGLTEWRQYASGGLDGHGEAESNENALLGGIDQTGDDTHHPA
jgi:hypothetical protein